MARLQDNAFTAWRFDGTNASEASGLFPGITIRSSGDPDCLSVRLTVEGMSVMGPGD